MNWLSSHTQRRGHRCVERPVTNWFTLKVLPTSTNMSDILHLPPNHVICKYRLEYIHIEVTNTYCFFI